MVDNDDLRALKSDWLYCLLVQVHDDKTEDIQRGIEQVISICVEHHGVIAEMMVSLQLVVFGLFGDDREKCRENSRTTKDALLAWLGNKVRIVAFEGDIAYGNIGTNERMNYTVVVPKFGRFLSALLSAQFGAVTELGSI